MKTSSLSNKKRLLNLLIIDDEEAVLKLNEELLSPYFTIIKAQTLDQAICALQENSIQVIISDHYIGAENGLNFLLSLKETYPEIIKMLLTGCVSHEIMLKSHNSREVFKYLTKPCANSEIIESAKLAEIAWQVLQYEKEVSKEHREYKTIIEDTKAFSYKTREMTKAVTHFTFLSSRTIAWLCLGGLLLGAIILLTLYSLKSILGIDIFS
jgi:response regulator RpfG family c-di-GMP phosphodiesterase